MSSFRRRRTASHRRWKRRRFHAEQLEDRRLLAASPHHNEANALDVSGDSFVSPYDALLVINHLNETSTNLARASAEAEDGKRYFRDTNKDGVVSPGDALRVLNYLNGEGENGDVVVYSLEIRESTGTTPTSAVGLGQTFVVVAFIDDERMGVDQVGAQTAYIDVKYPAGRVTGVPHSTTPADTDQDPIIDHRNTQYTILPNGLIRRDGFIDIAGGVDNSLFTCGGNINNPACPGPGPVEIWRATFRADTLGSITFTPEPTTNNPATDPDDVQPNGDPQSPTFDTNLWNENNIVCPAFNPATGQEVCMGTMGLMPATVDVVEDIRAVDDAFTVLEDSSNNDLDVIGPAGGGMDVVFLGPGIFLESFTQPANGTVTRNENGTPGVTSDDTLLYTPDPHYFGTPGDQFDYTINNGATPAAQSTATVRIDVTPSNDAPVNTVPNDRTINEDEAVTFTEFSVSDPDNNVQGEINVMVTLSTAAGGTLDVVDGAVVTNDNSANVTIEGSVSAVNAALSSVTFTPLANSENNDTITMLTNDLGNVGGNPLSTQSQVVLTINAANDAPAITAPTGQSVFFLNTLTFAPPVNPITVADVDSSNLTVTLTVPRGTLNATQDGAVITDNLTGNVQIAGTVQQVNNALNGLVFDPVDNVVDTVTLVISATDSIDTATATVTIQVIPPTSPFAIDDRVTIMEGDGTNVTNIDVLKRGQPDADLEPAGGTNRVLSITQPPAGQGTAVLQSDGTVDYTAPADLFGTVGFTYTINAFDGANPPNPVGDGEATGNVLVTITPKNDQPQINVPATPTVNEGGELNFGNGITVADADSPFDPNYSAMLTLSVANGELEATPGGAAIQNNNSGNVIITGTIDQLNSALNGLKYRPFGVIGVDDTLNIVMDDLGNEGNGGEPHTNQATLLIDVIAQNNDPTVSVPQTAQTFITNFDNILSIPNNNAIQVTDVDAAGNNIQVMITSSDSQATFTISDLSVVPDGSNGTNTLTLLGPVTAINSALGSNSLNFRTPNAGQPTIIVTANDLGNTGVGGGGDIVETFSVEVFDFIGSNVGGRVFIEGPLQRPMEGVAVRLSGQDFRGVAVDQTVFTDRNGRYLHANIRPGEYSLEEVQPAQVQDGQDALTAILTADGNSNNDRGLVSIGIRGGVDSRDNDFGERGLTAATAGALNELLASSQNMQGLLVGPGGWAIFLGDTWNGYSTGRVTMAADRLSASVSAVQTSTSNTRTATVHITSARLRAFHDIVLIRGTVDEIFGTANRQFANRLAQIQPSDQAVEQYRNHVDQIMDDYSIA